MEKFALRGVTVILSLATVFKFLGHLGVDMAIKNPKIKVDVQKGSLRIRGKLTIDVLVSSNLPHFIQMTCILGSCYYDLYPMDEKMFNGFLVGK